MADTTTDEAEVFRPQALGRLQTADDLDAYIRVTSQSGWIVLIAAIVFLAAIIVWSNTALIPTTRTFSGLQEDDFITAWVDEATYHNIKSGQTTAKVAGIRAKLLTADDTPMSRSEIMGFLGYDFLTQVATIFDWNYVIVLRLEGELKTNERSEPIQVESGDETYEARLVPVDVTTAETHPIRLVFQGE